MKSLMIGLLIVSSTASLANAALSNKCESFAVKEITKKIGRDYDKEGIFADECRLAPNNAIVICELSATKGDGAAIDGYRVILNKTCKKMLRYELTSEE